MGSLLFCLEMAEVNTMMHEKFICTDFVKHPKEHSQAYCTVHKGLVHMHYAYLLRGRVCPLCAFDLESKWKLNSPLVTYDHYNREGIPFYPEGTSYFNGREWKPLRSFTGGEVAGVNPASLKMEMMEPLEYLHSEEVKYFKYNLTPYTVTIPQNGKTLLYMSSPVKEQKVFFANRFFHKIPEKGFPKCHIISNMNVEEMPFPYSDNMFFLMIYAFFMKGVVSNRKVRFFCELERVKELLEAEGISYTEDEGMIMANFSFKEPPIELYRLGYYHREIFFEEFLPRLAKAYPKLLEYCKLIAIQHGNFVPNNLPRLKSGSFLKVMHNYKKGLPVHDRKEEIVGEGWNFVLNGALLLRQGDMVFTGSDGSVREEENVFENCNA